ncbi:unnamed protein product [Thlaspi arvense]|uniref:Uncharacterized protein n=1 Tax=Thlaspi arvense TaxID=13288 RepID=A0AAU9SUV4_THLAR|nr:unnamed protein product [Thlaspi arvense]
METRFRSFDHRKTTPAIRIESLPSHFLEYPPATKISINSHPATTKTTLPSRNTMARRYTSSEKEKWITCTNKSIRRSPVRISKSDVSARIEENRLTLIGRHCFSCCSLQHELRDCLSRAPQKDLENMGINQQKILINIETDKKRKEVLRANREQRPNPDRSIVPRYPSCTSPDRYRSPPIWEKRQEPRESSRRIASPNAQGYEGRQSSQRSNKTLSPSPLESEAQVNRKNSHRIQSSHTPPPNPATKTIHSRSRGTALDRIAPPVINTNSNNASKHLQEVEIMYEGGNTQVPFQEEHHSTLGMETRTSVSLRLGPSPPEAQKQKHKNPRKPTLAITSRAAGKRKVKPTLKKRGSSNSPKVTKTKKRVTTRGPNPPKKRFRSGWRLDTLMEARSEPGSAGLLAKLH